MVRRGSMPHPRLSRSIVVDARRSGTVSGSWDEARDRSVAGATTASGRRRFASGARRRRRGARRSAARGGLGAATAIQLYVTDLDDAIDFYTRLLGFGPQAAYDEGENADSAFFVLESRAYLVLTWDPDRGSEQGGSVRLELAVDDLDAEMQGLHARGVAGGARGPPVRGSRLRPDQAARHLARTGDPGRRGRADPGRRAPRSHRHDGEGSDALRPPGRPLRGRDRRGRRRADAGARVGGEGAPRATPPPPRGPPGRGARRSCTRSGRATRARRSRSFPVATTTAP